MATPLSEKDRVTISMTIPTSGDTANKNITITGMNVNEIKTLEQNSIINGLVNPLQFIYGSGETTAIVKTIYTIDYSGIYEIEQS